MAKQVCFLLALLLFWDLTNSLTLIAPEEVKGLLQESVTIPCVYKPSPQCTDVVVTWYIDTNDILIHRAENDDYIPLSINRDRITMNHSPGDVSLNLKKLAYSDQGTYTCEVKCRFVNRLEGVQKRLSVNLTVVRADPLTLTVPEEVAGQLRESATIPCTYRPSPQYFPVMVTWYMNRDTILIYRDENAAYIPRYVNRGRISINNQTGDVSLVLKNLAYTDRGTYTCEVEWQFANGLKKTRRSLSVNLIVVRSLPSTRSPTSLTSSSISALSSKRPPVIPTSNAITGYNTVKVPAWIFVLTIILIVLFFSTIIILILYRTRNKTGVNEDHIYEFTRCRSVGQVRPVNLVSSENNEYETMKQVRQNEYSTIHMGSACASG
ncbi:V-set and immunoglobulin domain-containing protein 4 isoform X1 [Mobula hypostoma]|uniref:V-set and immunoglobulin domain-containing protein 4 isoform X1 n=1 Tax=Mobula hypostoma TaxID=723540 RepID=UPI002FC3DFD3